LKEASAAYYVKVFQKLATTPGYVEKELKRLTNIISKGGLAPQKTDDLTIRSNILKKFHAALTAVTGRDEL
jgi:protein disulfide-isomerase A6